VRRSRFKRAGYWLIRLLARCFCLLYFRIRVEGRQNFPEQGGGLICANHQSFMDPVLVGLCCDRRMNYLARQTLFRHTALRLLIDFLDAIPIDRDGMGLGGLKETMRRLKRDELVLIFPEGTRSEDGRVAPLKPGFCALVRRVEVPLIPVGIAGAYEAWPRTRRLPRPCRIRIVIGTPIEAERAAGWTDEQLVAELQARIEACHAWAGRGHRDPAGRTVSNAVASVGRLC
jgi:1-acyl-sn-glycerol-3-phosphate acyltransferase